ncbi:MAG: hypothetical protein HY660_07985 [Armatimonadetes bacterium]|nr:hypothetical protein [Armatimonadota bacterium]
MSVVHFGHGLTGHVRCRPPVPPISATRSAAGKVDRAPAGGTARGGVLAWIVVLTAALATLAVGAPALLARRAAAVLGPVVGPPDRVRVAVEIPAREMVRGRIGRIALGGRRVVVAGLPAEELQAELWRVPVKFLLDGRLRPQPGAGGRLWFSVTGEGLTRFLREARGIDGVEVRFAPDDVAVTGQVSLLGFTFQAEARGRLEVVEERRVHLAARRLSLSGVGLPPWLAASLMSRVNPIFDAATLSVPLRITGLMVGQGIAIVHLAMP